MTYHVRQPSPFPWKLMSLTEVPSWAGPIGKNFSIPADHKVYRYHVIFPGYYDLIGWRVATSAVAVAGYLGQCFSSDHRHKVQPCPSRYYTEPFLQEYAHDSQTGSLGSLFLKLNGDQA